MAESVVEEDGVDGFLVVVVFVREMLAMGSICRERKQRLWNDLMRRAKRICMSKLGFFFCGNTVNTNKRRLRPHPQSGGCK